MNYSPWFRVSQIGKLAESHVTGLCEVKVPIRPGRERPCNLTTISFAAQTGSHLDVAAWPPLMSLGAFAIQVCSVPETVPTSMRTGKLPFSPSVQSCKTGKDKDVKWLLQKQMSCFCPN